MTNILTVEALCKSYGAHSVLKNVAFDVADGEGFAIIGPNGAGKTTLFKTLTGEVSANSGTIRFGDIDVTDMPPHERVRAGFGRTFQVSRTFPDFTATENVVVAIEARRASEGTRVGTWYSWRSAPSVIAEAQDRLARLGLAEKRFVLARNLSHGDKKKLELAIALTADPRILMLDEPTAGMSPMERHQTVDLLRAIRQDSGMTLMLTEHDMDVVFGLADHILVLNYGEVIVSGSPEMVRADPVVAEIYLGQEMVHA